MKANGLLFAIVLVLGSSFLSASDRDTATKKIVGDSSLLVLNGFEVPKVKPFKYEHEGAVFKMWRDNELVSIIDKRNMLIRKEQFSVNSNGGITKTTPSSTVIWLANVDTERFSDSKVRYVILVGPMKYIGQKTYTTVNGQVNTVDAVEPATKEDVEGLIKVLKVEADKDAARKASEDAEIKKKEEAAKETQFRVFKSADGKFSVKARFIESKGTLVKLQRADDEKVVSVEIKSLSKEDFAWILAKNKAEKEKAKLDAKSKAGAAKDSSGGY